jgi:hypothetical protein
MKKIPVFFVLGGLALVLASTVSGASAKTLAQFKASEPLKQEAGLRAAALQMIAADPGANNNVSSDRYISDVAVAYVNYAQTAHSTWWNKKSTQSSFLSGWQAAKRACGKCGANALWAKWLREDSDGVSDVQAYPLYLGLANAQYAKNILKTFKGSWKYIACTTITSLITGGITGTISRAELRYSLSYAIKESGAVDYIVGCTRFIPAAQLSP